MTNEQIKLRKKAAVMFHDAIEVVAKIKEDTWDVPTSYIKSKLRQWSEMYGYNEVSK